MLNQWEAQWGYAIWGDPFPLLNGAAEPLQPLSATPGDGSFVVQFECLDVPTWPYDEIWWDIYLQVSSLIPSIGSGLSNTPPIGVRTASGYVYVGKVGPLTPLTPATFDWTDVITALYGKLPMAATANSDPHQFIGSIFDLQVFTHDQIGQIVYASATAPAPPTPPTVGVSYSFQDYVQSTLGTSARNRPVPALTASRARFYPKATLLPGMNRKRRLRAVPALRAEDLIRGFPAIAPGATVLS
jgi:hypothetical protein